MNDERLKDGPGAPLKAEAPEAKTSLRKAAMRGSTITIVGHGLSILIRIGGNLVITRLLMPEYFGLMALVMALLIGLHFFSDTGVGPNIIQSSRGNDPVFLNTAWTIQVMRGVILWIIACMLALPMARFYEKPELLYLVPVASISAIFGGADSTKLYTLNRELEFVRITVLEVASQFFGVVVMIAIGWWFRSVWALAAAGLVSAAAKSIMSHAMLPGIRNRFAWDPSARKSIVEFGRWILIGSAITFLASQNDRLILGKIVSSSELGLYAIAANLATMPVQAVLQVINKVFYPVVAAAMRQVDHDPASIRDVRTKLLVALMPIFAIGISMAPAIISILYDPRYRRVGLIASYLLIGAWLAIVASAYAIVLLANGQPKYNSYGQGLKTIICFGLIWFVAPEFGVEGVALVVGLSELGFFASVAFGCRSLQVLTLTRDFMITLSGAASVGFFILIYRAVILVTGQSVFAVTVVSAVGLGMSGFLAKRTHLVS